MEKLFGGHEIKIMIVFVRQKKLFFLAETFFRIKSKSNLLPTHAKATPLFALTNLIFYVWIRWIVKAKV